MIEEYIKNLKTIGNILPRLYGACHEVLIGLTAQAWLNIKEKLKDQKNFNT